MSNGQPLPGCPLSFLHGPQPASLTDDLDCQVDLVLAHWVLHDDSVDTLVFLLGPLDSEDAAVLGGLHSDAALGVTQQLVGAGERKGSRWTPEASAASGMANSPKMGKELSAGSVGEAQAEWNLVAPMGAPRTKAFPEHLPGARGQGAGLRLQLWLHPGTLGSHLSSLCLSFLVC